jgi:hypothetical protein
MPRHISLGAVAVRIPLGGDSGAAQREGQFRQPPAPIECAQGAATSRCQAGTPDSAASTVADQRGHEQRATGCVRWRVTADQWWRALEVLADDFISRAVWTRSCPTAMPS